MCAYRINVGDGCFIGDQYRRAAVLQTVFEGIRTEQHGHRHGNRTELLAGDMGYRHLGPLRQYDGDPHAAHDAQRMQQVCQLVRIVLQLCVGDSARTLGRIVDEDGDTLRVGRPAPAAELGNVEVIRQQPVKVMVQLSIAVTGGR